MMGLDLYTTVNSPPSCAFAISMYGSDCILQRLCVVCVSVCECVSGCDKENKRGPKTCSVAMHLCPASN